MKIKYVCHASLQVICADGSKILSDPWQYNPIYGNMMWLFPPAKITKEEFLDQDFIYISHLHPDHLCFKTLSHFDKSIPVIIRKYGVGIPLAQKLKDFGFGTIIEIDHRQTIAITDKIEVTLVADLSTNDSSLIIKDQDHCTYFQNDCLLPAEEMDWIGQNFSLDLACLFYMGVGLFPGSFDLPLEEKKRIVVKKKEFCFERAIRAAEGLKSPRILPYSSDMVWLRRDDLVDLYSVTAKEFYDYAKSKKVPCEILLMSSGEIYDFSQSEDDFKNYIKSREEFLALFREYQSQHGNQDLIAKLDVWERGHHFEPVVFETLFRNYCIDTMSKGLFSDLQHGVKIGFVVVAKGNENYFYEIFFSNLEKRIESVVRQPIPQNCHMVMHVDDYMLAMAIQGSVAVEDLGNNRFFIQRNGSYNYDEGKFWDYLEAFTWYLEKNYAGYNKNASFKYKVAASIFETADAEELSVCEFKGNTWQGEASTDHCACVGERTVESEV